MTDVASHPAVYWFLLAVNLIMFTYTVLLQSVYTALTWIGWRRVDEYMRRLPLRDYDYVSSSPLSIPVSVLVPAFNEELTVPTTVRALLQNNYAAIEIVIVNDGSTDDTLRTVIDEFGLVRSPRTPRSGLVTEPVHAVYVCPSDPRIILIDKANGGKADALNAAINYARYPLVCSVDADTIVDPAALERLVWEFQQHPETVATGGTIRIANGSVVRDGRIVEPRTPPRLLANLQVVEYLRAFLGSRVGWSDKGMLLIISGAFGLFRRSALVNIGGYDTDTVGEDAELVVRLYRDYLGRGEPFRATFFADPVCWTEAPERWRTLGRQRNRWQRGLTQLLWKHRAMVFNRRYGRMGKYALPYFWLFELIGPVVEVAGYIALPLAWILGILNTWFAVLMFTLAIGYGIVLSLMALLIEEQTFRRYPNWRDLLRLILAIVVENFGYRQWLAFVRVKAMVGMWRTSRKHAWGHQVRAGFNDADTHSERPVPVPEAQPSADATTAVDVTTGVAAPAREPIETSPEPVTRPQPDDRPVPVSPAVSRGA